MPYWLPSPALSLHPNSEWDGQRRCSLCTRTQVEMPWLPVVTQLPALSLLLGWWEQLVPPQDRSPCPLESSRWRFALVSPLRGGNEVAVRPLSCSPWKYLRREVTSWESAPRQLAEPGRPGSHGCCRESERAFTCSRPFTLSRRLVWLFFPKVRKVKTKLTLNSFFPLFPILFLDKARG